MAVPNNTITSQDIDAALSQEFVMNFQHDFDRLADLMGIFGVETRAAGTALYQLAVSGTLNNSADTTNNTGSSGTAYIEGDYVNLSKYKVEKVPIGDLTPRPYRKMTTAKAILQNGYEGAVLKTDNLMLSQIRSSIIADFIGMLGNGSAAVSGTIAGLQEAIALTDAAVLDNMEDNGDSTDAPLVHFVNRMDAAKYLANAPISTQSAFGLTYLENFLGVERVFLTGSISSGTLYATSAANIHVFGCDFGELSRGGLVYETESSGLIGVAHKGAYDYASAETNVMVGAQMIPEVLDYIGKTTFTPDA